MRTWILVGCTVIAGLVAAACGSATGGNTGGSGGETTTTTSKTTTKSGTGGVGGAPSPCGTRAWSKTNAACSSCMDDNCCDALLACDDGTPCAALADCLALCTPGNDNCVTACETAHTDGQTGVDALRACFTTNCKESPSCGTKVCDTGVSVSTQACGDCLTASCCDSWKLCSQDNPCLDCLVTNAPSCMTNTLFTSAVSCQNASCGPLCAARICDTTLGYPDLPACNDCLGKLDVEGGCCEETEACAADTTCRGCLTGKVTVGCDTNAALTDYDACRTKCATVCN